MQRLSIQDAELAMQTQPSLAQQQEYLHFEGTLRVQFPSRGPVPDKLYWISSTMEKIIVDAYPTLKVNAEEMIPNAARDAEDPTYWGVVTAAHPESHGGLLVYLQSSVTPLRDSFRNLNVRPAIKGILPLAPEYQDSTYLALPHLWSLIHSFDVIFSSQNLPPERNGECALFLMKNNALYAQGACVPAYLGLHLKPKPKVFMMNGVPGI